MVDTYTLLMACVALLISKPTLIAHPMGQPLPSHTHTNTLIAGLWSHVPLETNESLAVP